MKKKDEAWRHAHHGSCFDGCGELVPSGVPESFDARDWAHEFNVIAQSLGYSAMDDGWLTTWFANSIMRGYDEAQRRRPASGLCDKHEIDPVWDECPCCALEHVEGRLQKLELAAANVCDPPAPEPGTVNVYSPIKYLRDALYDSDCPPSLEGVAPGHVWERISGGWSLRKVDS